MNKERRQEIYDHTFEREYARLKRDGGLTEKRRFWMSAVKAWRAVLVAAGFQVSTTASVRERAERHARQEFDLASVGHGPKVTLQALRVRSDWFLREAHLRQGVRANWAGVDPALAEFYYRLYRRLRREGLPVYCHTCVRSAAEQSRLFERGLSRVRVGAHQSGSAIDVVHAVGHWDVPSEFWDYIGYVGKQIAETYGLPIEWGGDWEFYDPAHWQVAHWRKRPLVASDDVVRAMPDALRKFVGKVKA